MKKLLTLATVGAFVLSLQGASLAQQKEDKGPAGSPPPAAVETPPPGTATQPETAKPEKEKTTKKKATKKKKKTTKKKPKPKKPVETES
ncbi:MAG: hypothetical protein FJ128_12360 [Deltaproteobacteria bacterium]|nr:hypothetical protein [Deltaproteobacteria bacterium]